MVYQDKALFAVDSGTSHLASFPSTLLNEPCCRDFAVVLVDVIKGNKGIDGFEIFSNLSFDNGVFEETAGIAQLAWVREFAISDGENGVAQQLECDFAAVCCQGKERAFVRNQRGYGTRLGGNDTDLPCVIGNIGG